MAANVQIFGSESLDDYQVTFFEDLATIPNPILGETAKVEKPSGGLFGIGSNEPGTYLFNGTDWEFLSRTLKQEILTKASAAQGALADTAVQPGDLGTVATSNDYNDLDNLPTLPGPAPVDSVNGETGVVVLDKSDIGLSNVDNTSDLNKPISSATQLALNSKSDIGHSHTKADITDFNDADYATAAQGLLADSALQNGDNISELNNDEGFISTETDPIFQSSEASNFVAGDKSNLDNQSGVNTGDETTSSIQTKRPLKTVNGNSLEGLGDIVISGGSGAEDLDDLTDVNTQSVIPQNGWVLKRSGSVYIPSMKEIVISPSLVVNTNSSVDLSKINTSFNFQRTGTYSITVNFSYSYNRGNTDFIANLEFDGFLLGNVGNGEILTVEPKDSAGNEFDGRGTNQKLNFSQTYYVDIFTIGNKNINLTFKPQQNNVAAAMWDTSIIIEEQFGIINL